MNNELKIFLDGLKIDDLVHFIFSETMIIGKFSKYKGDSVILQSRASVLGQTLAGETSIDVDKIVAWGYGGKYN